MQKLLLMAILFFIASCGYQWGNRNEGLPENYTKVAIPVFKNKTKEIGAEMYFTNAIIEEIVRSPKNQLTSIDDAEVVLEGEISNLRLDGEGLANFSDDRELPKGTELYSNYQLNLVVNLRMRRKSDQKIIWAKSLGGEKNYAAAKIAELPLNSANPLYNHSALHLNLQAMADELMEQAYFNLTESF